MGRYNFLAPAAPPQRTKFVYVISEKIRVDCQSSPGICYRRELSVCRHDVRKGSGNSREPRTRRRYRCVHTFFPELVGRGNHAPDCEVRCGLDPG